MVTWSPLVCGQLLVSAFSPSALIQRDLLKAGCDSQLSLTKTGLGSYFSFPFYLGFGHSNLSHPALWHERQLCLGARADLLIPLQRGGKVAASKQAFLPFHLQCFV